MIFRKSKPGAKGAAAPARTQTPEETPKKPKPAAGPSILTSDLALEGNLATNGELQIDGTVHGSVRASACIVEANGAVHGPIVAEDVFIRGRVIGPICGVHVTVVAGGHVEGDVLNQSIAIENGAYIDGKIRRSEDPMGEWQQMWYGEEAQAGEDAYAADAAAANGYAAYGAEPSRTEETFDIAPARNNKTGG